MGEGAAAAPTRRRTSWQAAARRLRAAEPGALRSHEFPRRVPPRSADWPWEWGESRV